jgi:hypothetical protein
MRWRAVSAPGAERPGDETPAAGETPPGVESRPGDEAMARGYARSRAKADAIRAELTPLGPDERPLGLKLAVALAVLIAVANLVGAIAGVGDASPAVGLAFALAMGLVAAGLWARIYLVLLLFQALLAFTIIIATLSLAVAGNAVAVVVAVGLIVLCSPVFWLLIRVMARLQVPRS